MFAKGLFTLAFALENSAIGSLFLVLPAGWQLLLFMTLHGIASLLVAIVVWRFLPRHYRQPSQWVIALLACFSLFMPVLGMVGMLLGSFLLHRYQQGPDRAGILSVSTPAFLPETHTRLAQFGEGGVRARLLSAQAPTNARLKALMAMGAAASRNANEIFRMVLGDDDDEVRLLAFGFLDSREKEINAHIHNALQQLKSGGTPAEQAQAHRQLALLYWELVYQELAQGDLMRFALDRSLQHARHAVAHMPEDAALLTLLGRIHLQRRESAQAMESFTRALALGGSRNRIIPYLAELHYIARDFSSLRELLENSPVSLDIPTLGPVARFWTTTS